MMRNKHFSRCAIYFCLLVLVTNLCHLCFSYDMLCLNDEKQALLEFKHGLIDEGDRLASWVNGEESDCCRWAGIVCDNITGHVHKIKLPGADGHCDYPDYGLNQRLSGNLSSSLLRLKQLRYLDLSCNKFGGIQVPSFIGSLGNLRYLNLSLSEFSGFIPQLGNLTKLRVLCIGHIETDHNYPTAVVKNMQWMTNLRLLQYLDMSRVDLSKAVDWVQVISSLPSLVQLHLGFSRLTNINPHVTIVNLTSLSVLDLSYNHFHSSFPRWIFSLTSLVSLDLSGCNFIGPTFSNFRNPSINSFRNLTSLELLSVSENDFMNSSLVLEELSSNGGNLISLAIGSCSVSSSALDSLHNLTSILYLDLSNNQLTKRISLSLGNFCNLIAIDLSYNYFRNISLTYLLESYFKCKSPKLESLALFSSELSGHIPDQIGRLIYLNNLYLSQNNITGNIPNSIGQLYFLSALYLADNLISGPVPNIIGQLSSLEMLSLSGNQLNGSLPETIGRISSLVLLDLSNNKLSGSLPDSLGQLSKLERFSFSSNFLTGVVTEAHFAKLVNLNFLNGTDNNLTLTPRLANWIPPFNLRQLYLNSWGLGPQFPLWLQSQRNLEELDISNTGISSPLPRKSFWRSFPNLVSLDVSQNHIQGTLLGIPATVRFLDISTNMFSGKLPNFSNGSVPFILNLSNNLFSGTLHRLLCSSDGKETSILNLGNNSLSSIIPECWEKWSGLSFLNMENNNLSGSIPATMGSLPYLESLNMRGNKISGRLPTFLMKLTSLKILQLSRNELVGSIPASIGTKLPFLKILNLRYNNLDGNIPPELCYLTTIQILDLANNNLSGNIPTCFDNFNVLSGKQNISNDPFTFSTFTFSSIILNSDTLVMKGREDTYSTILRLVMLLDLSSNNLVGHIPRELTSLQKLKSLNLSRNGLTGSIPEDIGNMKSLESFDLSLNKLSGELPVSLSSLNFLSSFNVSYNSLTGRVPSSTQLQSFTESSFIGNKLCGPPLTKRCADDELHESEYQKEDDGSNWELIVSIVLGFFVGFWIVVAPLILSRSWRIKYFHFLCKRGSAVYDDINKYSSYMFSK